MIINSNVILLSPENIYSASFHFFYVYWCFFKSHSRLFILVNVSHALKKGVYSAVFMYYKCQLSQLMSVMFKSSIYLLIFFLTAKLSSSETAVLKFLHRIMYFSLFSSAMRFTYFRIVFLDTYTFRIIMSFWWIDSFKLWPVFFSLKFCWY